MRAPTMAAAAALCALAAAAGAWPWHGALAHASDESRVWADFDIFHGGVPVEEDRISPMMVTGEPVTVELRYAGHWEMGEGRPFTFHDFPAPGEQSALAISMDVIEWRGIGEGHAGPPPEPTLVDHGDGTASLTVDRSAPTDGRIRLSAGEVDTTFGIRVMPHTSQK